MANENDESRMLEIQSVQAIFPDAVIPISDHQIAVQCAPDIQLKIQLLAEYPNVLPYFELCAPSLNGEQKRNLLIKLERISSECIKEPMLYPLIDAAMEEYAELRGKTTYGKVNTEIKTSVDDAPYPEAFYLGETIEDRKSTFQAHVAKLENKEQIPHLLHKLKAVGKVSKARHNPYAWRLVKKVEGTGGEGGAATESREFDQHDCDDDGEDGAGPKLLGLLMKMDARGVLVVVSRWKSGAKIGPDRFRHFSNAARDALIAGKFVKDEKSQQPSSNG